LSSVKSPRGNRETILDAAEELMAQRGFHAVSMREISRAAEVNLGSVTYYFGTKEKLLAEIYDRHTRPMNQRRMELLEEAARISDRRERLSAIIRAFVVPAFSSNIDSAGGGARFTRLRAILSMEGNETAGRIIAGAFDNTSCALVDAIGHCLPEADEEHIVWRCHFLLGALYYTLVNGGRINRLTDHRCDGNDRDTAIEQLVNATVASLDTMWNAAPRLAKAKRPPNVPLGTATS
jgi:AcrR family transcriptional regulator